MGDSRGLPLYLLLCFSSGFLDPSAVQAQSQGLGFDFKLGYSEMGADWGGVIQDGVEAEVKILYSLKRLRLGGGFNWVSYGLVTSLGGVDSGSQVGMQLAVAYPFREVGWIRPYVEGRLTWDRFRAKNRGDGFPDPDEEDGNNAPRYAGWGGTGVVGVFIPNAPEPEHRVGPGDQGRSVGSQAELWNGRCGGRGGEPRSLGLQRVPQGIVHQPDEPCQLMAQLPGGHGVG